MLTASNAMDWRLYLSEVTAVLTETYSASTFAISALMSWPDRSHDAILFALLSRKGSHPPPLQHGRMKKGAKIAFPQLYMAVAQCAL